MGKNIFKSIVWVMYFFFVQIIITIGTYAVYLMNGKISFSDTTDADVLANELINTLLLVTVPALAISAVIVIVTFLLYILIRKHKLNFNQTKLKESAFCLNIGIASNGIITLVLLFINYIIDMLLGRFLELFSDTTTTDIVLTGHPFWLLLLSTGILVPIMEEIVFRYGLCGTLARNNKKTALILSAIIFGVVHGNIIQAVYATVLGLIMGMLYLKYENLIYPIIVHIAINSSSVIVSEIGYEWIICAVGLVSLIICILMIKSQPELKEFKFLKEKKELKPLPSLRDIAVQEESVIETHDFKEE